MSEARTLALLDEVLAVNRRLESVVSNLIAEVKQLRQEVKATKR